ncbi:hypothetical protein LCGC14_1671000 [marine sediment metagenome]|uniref:Uncharacterized protein n=1 Tax=marine sediment metagenome TaxID=412755 RepID=A0A0F9HRD4_9ZZZZ
MRFGFMVEKLEDNWHFIMFGLFLLLVVGMIVLVSVLSEMDQEVRDVACEELGYENYFYNDGESYCGKKDKYQKVIVNSKGIINPDVKMYKAHLGDEE